MQLSFKWALEDSTLKFAGLLSVHIHKSKTFLGRMIKLEIHNFFTDSSQFKINGKFREALNC